MISPAEIFETHNSPGRFANFSSDDREETEAFATSLYCPHDFRLASREKRLGTRMAAASLSDVGLASIGFRANVTVDPGTLDDFYLIQTVVAGSVDVVSGNQRCLSTPGIATVISPNQATRMIWDRAAHFLSVKVGREALESQLAEITGEAVNEPVVFDLRLDLNRDQSRPWQSVVEALYHHLRYADWHAENPYESRLLERWLVSTLLHTQAHNYSARLSRTLPSGAPKSLRRAIRFIERHFSHEIPNRKIADAAGVSERKLHSIFQKYLGKTAKQYQLNMRLRYVRSVLHDGRPDTSVTNVFADAGVQHHGRFSGCYKAEFGELPSATLANAREHYRKRRN